MMVDSDHAGEKRTQLSRTGFIIFCNLAPIIWLSKQQATIETSVFGAEFVARKHDIKTLRGLRYKIPMMGIPLSGPTYMYGDNQSQVINSSRPESTLKKKCNSICYHAICELDAMGETLLMHIRTGDNLANFLTKTTSGAKHRKLVSGVVHDIYDYFPKTLGLQDHLTDPCHPNDLEGTERMCPSGGNIGWIQCRFRVGSRSFLWNWSIRNGGVFGESSTYFRKASRRLNMRQEQDWPAPDAC
jgi:hypothetical protein